MSLFTKFGVMASMGERDIINTIPKLAYFYHTENPDTENQSYSFRALAYNGGAIINAMSVGGEATALGYDVTDATKAYIYVIKDGISALKLNSSTGATVSSSSSIYGAYAALLNNGRHVTVRNNVSPPQVYEGSLSLLTNSDTYTMPSDCSAITGIAVDNQNRVYVSYRTSTSTYKIIRLTCAVADIALDATFSEIALSYDPKDMVCDRDGNLFYVISNGTYWTAQKRSPSGALLFTITSGAAVAAATGDIVLTYNGDFYWFTNYNSSSALHHFGASGSYIGTQTYTYAPDKFDVNGYSYACSAKIFRQLNTSFAAVWSVNLSTNTEISTRLNFETGDLGSCGETWW